LSLEEVQTELQAVRDFLAKDDVRAALTQLVNLIPSIKGVKDSIKNILSEMKKNLDKILQEASDPLKKANETLNSIEILLENSKGLVPSQEKEIENAVNQLKSLNGAGSKGEIISKCIKAIYNESNDPKEKGIIQLLDSI
jgi:endonuclease III